MMGDAHDQAAHVVASLRRIADDLERREARITEIDHGPSVEISYSTGAWVSEATWRYTVEGCGAPGTLSVTVEEVRPVAIGAWRVR